jgi:hypothetical protein
LVHLFFFTKCVYSTNNTPFLYKKEKNIMNAAKTEKEYRRAVLLKKLKSKRKFLQAVRSSAGGAPQAKEIIEKYNREADEDQKELMTNMVREMKGMPRPTAKKYVKDVTQGMSEDQLSMFREQVGPSLQHLIPTQSNAPSEAPKPHPYDATATPRPRRGLQRLNATIPTLAQPHMVAVPDVLKGLPAPQIRTRSG